MTQRVLLTGGAGFIGSHLVRACRREGWQVGVLCKPQSALDQIQDLLDEIQVYPVDGSTESVLHSIEKFKPALVFHLASVFRTTHSPEDILPLIESNVAFGAQVLEAMSTCGVPYFVNTSTSWQHYCALSYNPVNLYAATKQAFEDIVEFYAQSEQVTAISLKLYDTYGPGDSRPKLFKMLESAARENVRLEMSPGEQLIDIVYVDDVVRAFVISAWRLFNQQATGHERYAVSSGSPIRLRDLVALYQRVTGQQLEIVWGGRPYREREVMVPWSNGPQLPGWTPEINLDRGIHLMKGEDK